MCELVVLWALRITHRAAFHLKKWRAIALAVESAVAGASWGWLSQARHKRPRSTPIEVRSFVASLKKNKKNSAPIIKNNFEPQKSTALPGLEPPTFYLRKKNTKFDAKSEE